MSLAPSPDTDPIVVVSAARTPIAMFQGAFASLSANELGAAAIGSALARGNVSPDAVSEVLMGCVLPAGLGQAPARQAARAAGLPDKVGCTTVNKMCGSGMKTIMQAVEALRSRPNDIIVAGGMESMTNAPYLLPKMRSGARIGHAQVLDHMFFDGLEDAYDKGRLMGTYAEDTAAHYQFARQAQDAFAIESLHRARRANENGAFGDEIVPITVSSRSGDTVVDKDEQPFTADPEKIPKLKPVFRAGGTVTPANSSSISDGAAAVVLMRQSTCRHLDLKPLATVVAMASYAQEPAWFTTAPIAAITKVTEVAGWGIDEVDLFEINEAFAVVTMAAMSELKLSHDRVNVNGGACALGHPVGASGARIIVTLLNAMKQRRAQRAIAAICIGGGEATAMAFEAVP